MSTLFSRLLPGPVTLVVPRGKFIPEHVNPNCETIGIRIPDNTISRRELAQYKKSKSSVLCNLIAPKRLLSQAEPLCLTSANKSGAKSAITSNDFADLHPLLDAIVETELGIPTSMSRAGSTVVGMRSKLMFAFWLVFFFISNKADFFCFHKITFTEIF